MTDERCLEQRLQQLGNAIPPGSTFTESVMSRVVRKTVAPAGLSRRTALSAAMLEPRWMMLAVLAIVMAAIWIFPFGDPAAVGSESWWLAPTSVWAAEVQANIEKADLQGYSSRELVTFVSIGSGSTANELFVTGKSYRRDIYEEDRLQQTQWYVYGDDGLTLTGVHYIDKTYTVSLDPKSNRTGGEMSNLKAYMQSLFKSGKRVGAERVEGRDAIIFSIEPTETEAQNGQGTTTIWLDQATKMPLKMLTTSGIVFYQQDQYDWNPRFPANTFDPVIPAGFTKIDSQ